MNMVSIIICSRSSTLLVEVSCNIQETIGVPYEIIAIDNSAGKYGICEAYNIGAEKSRFENLCFMHEDILLHTTDWGSAVARILSDKQVGVIGVAGGTIQLAAPAGWGSAGADYMRVNIIQTTNTTVQKKEYYNPSNVRIESVGAVDGVWMCCRREVWQQFQFDSKALPGFHFYDIDFCVRVATKYSICVAYDILLEHFSLGTFDKQWHIVAAQFYKQRKSLLPVIGDKSLTKEEIKRVTLKFWHYYLHVMHADDIVSNRDRLSFIIDCLKMDPFNRDTLWFVKNFFKEVVSFTKSS